MLMQILKAKLVIAVIIEYTRCKHPEVKTCVDDNGYNVTCLSDEHEMIKAHKALCDGFDSNQCNNEDGFLPCRDQSNPCGILHFNHYCASGLTEGCIINVYEKEGDSEDMISELLPRDEYSTDDALARRKEGYKPPDVKYLSENYGFCQYSFYHITLEGPSANPDEIQCQPEHFHEY